jgi:hypothetical protein
MFVFIKQKPMDILTNFLIAIAVGIGLFFLLRNINLWYFRINEAIGRMDKQIELLEEIKNHLANGRPTVKSDSTNEVITSNSTVYKSDNFTKTNNIYTLTNGEDYELVKENDYFYFRYNGKKYYYADINAAEKSLNEIAMDNDPSTKDLVSIKNV